MSSYFYKRPEKHLKDVATEKGLLYKSGVELKINRGHFFPDTVYSLGHLIKPGKLEVAP